MKRRLPEVRGSQCTTDVTVMSHGTVSFRLARVSRVSCARQNLETSQQLEAHGMLGRALT